MRMRTSTRRLKGGPDAAAHKSIAPCTTALQLNVLSHGIPRPAECVSSCFGRRRCLVQRAAVLTLPVLQLHWEGLVQPHGHGPRGRTSRHSSRHRHIVRPSGCSADCSAL